jgi:hypothetical protein
MSTKSSLAKAKKKTAAVKKVARKAALKPGWEKRAQVAFVQNAKLKRYIERKVRREGVTIAEAIRMLCRLGMEAEEQKQAEPVASGLEATAGLDPVTDSEYPREME